MKTIREEAETLIAYNLAQKVITLIADERIGTNEHMEPALMEFFVQHLKISIEDNAY